MKGLFVFCLCSYGSFEPIDSQPPWGGNFAPVNLLQCDGEPQRNLIFNGEILEGGRLGGATVDGERNCLRRGGKERTVVVMDGSNGPKLPHTRLTTPDRTIGDISMS